MTFADLTTSGDTVNLLLIVLLVLGIIAVFMWIVRH